MRHNVRDQAHRLREIVAEKRAAGIQPEPKPKPEKPPKRAIKQPTDVRATAVSDPPEPTEVLAVNDETLEAALDQSETFESVAPVEEATLSLESIELPQNPGADNGHEIHTETTLEQEPSPIPAEDDGLNESAAENTADEPEPEASVHETDQDGGNETFVEVAVSPEQLIPETSIVEGLASEDEVPLKSHHPPVESKPAPILETVHAIPAKPRVARLPVAGRTRIWAITSGKGGVGKTNVTCNIALALSRMGKRVLVFDADLSLANVDILLGLSPKFNMGHVVRGEKTMREIVIEASPGLYVVPGVSGVEELANMPPETIERLLDGFTALENFADILLIDTAAGIHQLVMSFLLAADQVIVVTTPEPTAYMDAYALMKVLAGHDRAKKIQIIVNMATNDSEGREVLKLLTSMCRQWLQIGFETLGIIPRDVDVLQSVRYNTPILTHNPHCVAAKRLRHIAFALLNDKQAETGNTGLRGFMSRVFSRLRKAG